MAEPQSSFSQPWEEWNDEQRLRADKAVDILNGIKLYRSVGRLGVGSQYAPLAAQLEARGGISPDEATQLARYRMYKKLTQGDPDWQGPMNIASGPRQAPDTADQIASRRDAFFAASTEDRAKILAQEKLANDRSSEGFYDDLVKQQGGPPPVANMASSGKEITYMPARLKKTPKATTDNEKLAEAQLMMLQGLAESGQ